MRRAKSSDRFQRGGAIADCKRRRAKERVMGAQCIMDAGRIMKEQS
jgi:hypothetical protein